MQYFLCGVDYMDNSEIDIIIPAYNARNHIEKALYSIAIQKRIANFCVYVINDYSDYDYKEIINKFSGYYPIKELQIQKNMGPGYARQFGLDNSKGDYVVFIDSDDFFYAPDSLYKLYNEINTNKLDVVISNFYIEKNGDLILKEDDCVWLHGKIFSRKFLKKNNIRFNNTRSNEDVGFNLLVMFHKPSIGYLHEVTYFYIENINSITRANSYNYLYECLQYFAYNTVWATKIAINKKLDLGYPVYMCFYALVDMYMYYILFSDTRDISKIAYWSIDLKEIYDKYQAQYLDNVVVKNEINRIKNEHISSEIKLDCYISFDEFLNVIEEKKNDRHNNTSI